MFCQSISLSSLSKVRKPALLDGLRCSSDAKLKINERLCAYVSKNYRYIIIQYFLFKDKESITNLNLFTQHTSLKFYRSRHVDFKTECPKGGGGGGGGIKKNFKN